MNYGGIDIQKRYSVLVARQELSQGRLEIRDNRNVIKTEVA
jgi:hypothetical protein